MRVKIQLKDNSESLSLAKVNEISEKLSDTSIKQHKDFKNFFLKDDSSYIFVGDDIVTVRGKDILCVQFSPD